MVSKTIFLLGLLAMVLLITSEVSAREFSQTSGDTEAEKTNGVNEAKSHHGGSHCRHGCCGRKFFGRGCKCCTYAGEAVDAEPETKPHN